MPFSSTDFHLYLQHPIPGAPGVNVPEGLSSIDFIQNVVLCRPRMPAASVGRILRSRYGARSDVLYSQGLLFQLSHGVEGVEDEGVGLASVRRIVGREASSGIGTTFYVSLPRLTENGHR